MISCKPGDVVLTRFPFSDLESSKKRPTLVLRRVRHTDKLQLVKVAMITRQIHGYKLDGDFLLKDWKRSKLLHPSLVRFSKIATLDLGLIDKVLGKLTESDFKLARKTFQKFVDDWI